MSVHPDAKVALVAGLTNPVPGEYYLVFSEGDHKAERWKLNKSQLRWLVREAFPMVVSDDDREGGSTGSEVA